jgi:formylglycine-generating enzyme required for sulfatase activity
LGCPTPHPPRDGALVARAAAILRFVAPITRAPPTVWAPAAGAGAGVGSRGGDLPDGTRAVDWMPLFPASDPALAVSQFTAACPDLSGEGEGGSAGGEAGSAASAAAPPAAGAASQCTVWLMANTGGADISGATLNASLAFAFAETSTLFMYDLYAGNAVNETAADAAAGSSGGLRLLPASLNGTLLNVSVEAGGIAAILATPAAGGARLANFLAGMVNLTALPLANLSSAWAPLQQAMSAVTPTAGSSAPPPGTTFIAGGAGWLFTVAPVWPDVFTRPDAAAALAGGGVDVQYPWEAAPSASHAALLDVFPFFMDTNLVTNADFAAFTAATGYNATSAGVDAGNFLRHWLTFPNGTRTFNASAGDGPRPVTWVSRTDAQAFCGWLGKRLPTEWELQFAGQAVAEGGAPPSGADFRVFPWGNATCAQAPGACPEPDNSTAPRSPDAVGAHPAGASDLGVQDLVGNVWQLADAFCDARGCGVVLKGGSLYRPVSGGSNPSRYFPQALPLATHVKLPFLDDSGQRAAYVGFRCMADSAAAAAAGSTVRLAA